MEVKNLSQFKKAIASKRPFRIIKHYVKPEAEGQIRVPNVVQTNGFYSVEKDNPTSPVSIANNGKGYWMQYGKACDWRFDNGICTCVLHKGNQSFPVFSICFE